MTVRASDGGLELNLVSSFGLGLVGERCYGRTSLDEGQSAFVALSWRGRRPTNEEEAFRELKRTVEFWRNWLSGATERAHPKGPQLCADWRHHGGGHDVPSRDSRRGPELMRADFVLTAPNLGTKEWHGFRLGAVTAEDFCKPVSMLYDASIQGLGDMLRIA